MDRLPEIQTILPGACPETLVPKITIAAFTITRTQTDVGGTFGTFAAYLSPANGALK